MRKRLATLFALTAMSAPFFAGCSAADAEVDSDSENLTSPDPALR